MEFLEWFVIFITFAVGALADRFTSVYINNLYVRMFIYTIPTGLFVVWLCWILWGYKVRKYRLIIFMCVVALYSAKAFFTWKNDWQTQNVIYAAINDKNLTVEYQMRADWFSFGYKNRIVKRRKLFPFFDYITDVDTAKLNPKEWKRVDWTINELELHDYHDIPNY